MLASVKWIFTSWKADRTGEEGDRMLGQVSRNRPRALLIDERQEEIRTLAALMQRNQWQLSWATNGKRGLQLALAFVFDIILLEVRLSDMDGFAACRMLKESSITKDVPVIFLTHAGGIQDRLEGLACGAVDYLVKPCAPEEVMARIRIHRKLVPRPASDEVDCPERLPYDQMILRVAIRYIRENLSEQFSLEEIARHVGVYEKKLSSIFRRHVGVTVFTWVREERLRRSMELLVNSPLSIQDIAEEVGFCSACNFITAFRLRTDRTPNQFRKESMDRKTRTSQFKKGERCALI